MLIRFKTKKLEKILTNKRLIVKEYNKLSKSIMARINEFEAANNLSQITHKPPPRRHKLQGYTNRFTVDVSKNYRIVFSSIDETIVELEEIKEIIIIDICDIH